jgi:hypothetical protein
MSLKWFGGGRCVRGRGAARLWFGLPRKFRLRGCWGRWWRSGLRSQSIGGYGERLCCCRRADPTYQSIFGIHIDFFSTVKGGFFLRKKPLECVFSVYTNSEKMLQKRDASVPDNSGSCPIAHNALYSIIVRRAGSPTSIRSSWQRSKGCRERCESN